MCAQASRRSRGSPISARGPAELRVQAAGSPTNRGLGQLWRRAEAVGCVQSGAPFTFQVPNVASAPLVPACPFVLKVTAAQLGLWPVLLTDLELPPPGSSSGAAEPCLAALCSGLNRRPAAPLPPPPRLTEIVSWPPPALAPFSPHPGPSALTPQTGSVLQPSPLPLALCSSPLHIFREGEGPQGPRGPLCSYLRPRRKAETSQWGPWGPAALTPIPGASPPHATAPQPGPQARVPGHWGLPLRVCTHGCCGRLWVLFGSPAPTLFFCLIESLVNLLVTCVN